MTNNKQPKMTEVSSMIELEEKYLVDRFRTEVSSEI